MMYIHFNILSLQCRESTEVIDLSRQVSFFHGKVGSGKSSIARLIGYCLGGSLEKTPAITKELLTASLQLQVGEYEVLLERSITEGNIITATCVDKDQNSFSINVPTTGNIKPVWDDKVYNVSDLFFYLLDINVLRVPASRNNENTNLVRLTLRNFLWYCYLDQSKLDSSFFRQEDPTKARNSREVLKYILQYSTQRLIELEAELSQSRKKRFANTAAANSLRDFLKKFGFSTVEEINVLSDSTKNKLKIAKEERQSLERGYSTDTHSSDKIRVQIRTLIGDIVVLEQSCRDLESRIEQQESLRSELISSKFKLAKNEAVTTLFQGVDFENCPSCGNVLSNISHDPDHCKLCHSEIGQDKPTQTSHGEVVQADLNERIRELESSIDLHKKALRKAKKEFAAKSELRRVLDIELERELRSYGSIFLSNVRAYDKTIARLQERLKGIERLKRMPQEIELLDREVSALTGSEVILKQDIEKERSKLKSGEDLIQELEREFLRTLLKVGMPGVNEDDQVVINRKTWEVMVWPHGEEYLKWNFYNAGSGGKKTLFNSCFLLALHVVAANNDLPLPTFIIIDTPMKNIDKEVNQDIFRGFYNYVYDLAAGALDKTQFTIVDNNFIPPKTELNLSFYDRYMTTDDLSNPPLIRYYSGS